MSVTYTRVFQAFPIIKQWLAHRQCAFQHGRGRRGLAAAAPGAIDEGQPPDAATAPVQQRRRRWIPPHVSEFTGFLNKTPSVQKKGSHLFPFARGQKIIDHHFIYPTDTEIVIDSDGSVRLRSAAPSSHAQL